MVHEKRLRKIYLFNLKKRRLSKDLMLCPCTQQKGRQETDPNTSETYGGREKGNRHKL